MLLKKKLLLFKIETSPTVRAYLWHVSTNDLKLLRALALLTSRCRIRASIFIARVTKISLSVDNKYLFTWFFPTIRVTVFRSTCHASASIRRGVSSGTCHKFIVARWALSRVLLGSTTPPQQQERQGRWLRRGWGWLPWRQRVKRAEGAITLIPKVPTSALGGSSGRKVSRKCQLRRSPQGTRPCTGRERRANAQPTRPRAQTRIQGVSGRMTPTNGYRFYLEKFKRKHEPPGKILEILQRWLFCPTLK